SGIRSRAHKAALAKMMCDSSRTTYLAETGGDFDYELIVLERDVSEVTKFLGACSKRFGGLSFGKAVGVAGEGYYFRRKYLASGKVSLEQLTLGAFRKLEQISELDHRIMRTLSADPGITRADLARRAGCSPITVDAHLEKLRAAGILKGALFSFNAAQIGAQ